SEISYQALLNRTTSRRTDWAFRFNPDGLSEQWSFSAAHGLDWTRTLSATTFLEASLRQNYTEYHDWAYDDLFDERYDEAGPPQGDFGYELGAFVQGVSFTRYRRKTNSTVFKTSLVTQPNAVHQVKVGGEVNVSRVEFGSPGTLTYATVDGVERLVRHVNEPPDFPGVTQYRPVFGGVFAQDFLSFDDLTLRVGLRGDYFDSRAYLPGDLENPANSITGSPTAAPHKSSRKVSVSPRLGVAYPIEDFAAVHFAYGHFRQFPAIGDIFSNADYSVLANLQAGGTDFGVLGNPDVRPEFTVQYEIGYKQAIDENLGIDVTAFYKDIRDLLGVEFITTYNGAQYARLTNVDFGSVVGFTLTVDHRSLGPLDTHLDYTWQRASGNASDPRETATRAEAGEDPRPRLIPLNWDQRHTLNLTGSWNDAGPYNVSTVIRAVSGQPYTPVITAGFGGGLDTNSGRKPVGVDVDLRAERRVEIAGEGMNVFFRVFNVFDGRFFNGAVYPSTGSPYYSRFPEADAVSLGTPTRFEAPRRIEFGLRWQPEGSR
ncbi:MAG: TonB-dependent receptor, partial [Gemmatimonadetes bacterium]|nr:TonB-dependent receptor [Gemmatimonadota bacterium]